MPTAIELPATAEPTTGATRNPVLVACQAEVHRTWGGDVAEFLRWSIFPEDVPYAYLAECPEQVDHAERVLTKLAALVSCRA